MSKRISLAILFMLAFGVAAMAQDLPDTVVNVDWASAGAVNIDVMASNDMQSVFNVNANWSDGAYQLTNAENNPYNYGVHDVSAQVEAAITGGGMMQFTNTRLDSKASMYGNPGQVSDTFIGTSGTADMQFRTGTNYASMASSNYGWHANDHFAAAGDFQVRHTLTENSGEFAQFVNLGSGTTDIDFMSESVGSTTGSLSFGRGCGCYTNADITATGSGMFMLDAVGENLIDAAVLPFDIIGDGTLGSAILDLDVTYGGGLTVGDFSLSLN